MRYLFNHILMRDAVYDMQLRARLRELHRLAATAIEALYADNLVPYYADLAYHYGRAEMSEQERRYATLAGEQAAADYANAAAVRFFSRALDLTPAADLAGQYALLYRREQAYGLQGAREAQRRDLAALWQLAQHLDERRQVEVLLRELFFANAVGDWATATAAIQSVIERSREGRWSEFEAVAHAIWAQVLFSQGEYGAARAQIEQAHALLRSPQPSQDKVRCLLTLGNVAYLQGDHATAMAFYEQGLQVSRAGSHRQGECAALNNLATVLSDREDYAQARDLYERVLRLSREIGCRNDEALALGNLARVAIDQGDYTAGIAYAQAELQIAHEARGPECELQGPVLLGAAWHRLGFYDRATSYYEQALRSSRQFNARRFEGWAEALLGLVSHHQGDDGACIRHCRRALQITRETGERYARAFALTHLGHAWAAQGRWSRAATAYRQSLALRQQLGQPALVIENTAGLARVALAQGNLAEARRHTVTILHHLEERPLEGAMGPFEIYLTCYRVLRADRDPRAGEILAQSYDVLQRYAGRITDPEIRRSFLENIPANRALVAAWKEFQSEESLPCPT